MEGCREGRLDNECCQEAGPWATRGGNDLKRQNGRQAGLMRASIQTPETSSVSDVRNKNAAGFSAPWLRQERETFAQPFDVRILCSICVQQGLFSLTLPQLQLFHPTKRGLSCSTPRCSSSLLANTGTLTQYSFFTAWCLRNEGVSSVLLGTSTPEQLIENLGAIQVRPAALQG